MKISLKLTTKTLISSLAFSLCIPALSVFGTSQQESPILQHEVVYEKSVQYMDSGNLETALFFAKKLQKLAQQNKLHTDWEIKSVALIQEAFQRSENYDSALYYCYAGMELCEDAQSTFDLARFKTECGKNYLYAEKPNLAIDYLQESIKIFKLHGNASYVNYALGNLAIAYGMMDSLNKCEAILHKINHASQPNNTISHNQLATHINLAIAFIKQNRPGEALRIIKKIERVKNDVKHSGRFFLIKGQAYSKLNIDSAIYYLEKAHKQANASNNMGLNRIASYELAELLYKQKKYSEASSYYKMHIEIIDSIKSNRDGQYIENLGAVYKISRIEKEVDNLRRINKLSHQRTVLTFIVLGTTVCLVVIFLLWMKSRLNYARRTQNTLKKQLKNKKEVILQNALKYTQLFEATKTVLTRLKGAAEKGSEEGYSPEIRLTIKEEISSLQSITNSQWFFENQIDISNSEFIHYLKNKNSDLSTKELRLCVLMLTGLSSKEISSFINISDKTINNTRSVIRKKLNIPPQQHIQSYLEGLYKQCFLK